VAVGTRRLLPDLIASRFLSGELEEVARLTHEGGQIMLILRLERH
jgi:hypothetical protein